jgi:hypothetical protein
MIDLKEAIARGDDCEAKYQETKRELEEVKAKLAQTEETVKVLMSQPTYVYPSLSMQNPNPYSIYHSYLNNYQYGYYNTYTTNTITNLPLYTTYGTQLNSY